MRGRRLRRSASAVAIAGRGGIVAATYGE